MSFEANTVAQSASAAVALQTSTTTPNRSLFTSEESVDGPKVAAKQVQKETALAKEISKLWFSQSLRARAMRKTRTELKDRNKLAERLSQTEELSFGTGYVFYPEASAAM